mmetsp:Transcript_11443/g.70297  ORF Transcript_11443/g.70297 Transcript_11443/m.70297 type:complete len:120 (+) Transcript_11443:1792-2151(+)
MGWRNKKLVTQLRHQVNAFPKKNNLRCHWDAEVHMHEKRQTASFRIRKTWIQVGLLQFHGRNITCWKWPFGLGPTKRLQKQHCTPTILTVLPHFSIVDNARLPVPEFTIRWMTEGQLVH